MRTSAGTALILIAERDARVRELQEHFLTRAGFTVQFTGDGEDTIHRVRELQPALVVAEILIPKLDGLALCRRLAEDPDTAHIPVIIFSMLSAADRALEAGARAFLRKPLVESTFLAAVRDSMPVRAPDVKEDQWISR